MTPGQYGRLIDELHGLDLLTDGGGVPWGSAAVQARHRAGTIVDLMEGRPESEPLAAALKELIARFDACASGDGTADEAAEAFRAVMDTLPDGIAAGVRKARAAYDRRQAEAERRGR